jgi:CheY-like chemotaxis protein
MKRALVVDDSRSARVILSRMLESYALQVGTAESAEQALEYLRQTRPDVIFMDHLMPGMDGFQAVQTIKGNPDTAMIPVVMYTSQEGELYVSQARALGAVGVLPKTVNQADVSRILYQLHLLPERRRPGSESSPAKAATAPGARPTVSRAANHADAATVRIDAATFPPAEMETAIRTAVAPLLKEHGLEMRRLILASMEAFARRLRNDAQAVAAQPVHADPPAALAPAPTARRWPLAAAVATLALASTIVLALLYRNILEHAHGLAQSNSSLARLVAEQQSQLFELQQALPGSPLDSVMASAHLPERADASPVPYGETPLAGARLEHLREMISNLIADGFQGTLQVATFTGEFCLTGNGIEGYSLAADDMPLERCDLIGNPFEDSLTAAQRQSLAFANLVASVRQETGAALTVEIRHEGRQAGVPYPDSSQLAQLTAGEWNRIAARNNRVEFLAQPTGS